MHYRRDSGRPTATLVAIAVLAGACSVSDDTLDTEQAGQAIIALTSNATTDYVELPSCPFDPSGILLSQSVGEVTSPDVARALPSEFGAGTSIFQNDLGISEPYVVCDRFSDDSEAVGLVVAPPPEDFDRYVQVLVGEDTENVFVDRVGSEDHRGGTFERLCVNDAAEPDFSWCEVDWFDDNLHVTLYISGPATRPSDLDSMQAGLAAVLEPLIVALAE